MSISACMYIGLAHEYLISTELEEDVGPTGTRFKPVVNHHVGAGTSTRSISTLSHWVNPPICIILSVYVCVYVYVYMWEDPGIFLYCALSYFWNVISNWSWGSASLHSSRQAHHLSVPRLTIVPLACQLFMCGCISFKLKSSCLYDKNFTYWAICPVIFHEIFS